MRVNSTSFFFQAEDGIRGADVTGVQTCALPICFFLAITHQGVISTLCRQNSWIERCRWRTGLTPQIQNKARLTQSLRKLLQPIRRLLIGLHSYEASRVLAIVPRRQQGVQLFSREPQLIATGLVRTPF